MTAPIHRAVSVGSTQEEARRLAAGGAPEGTAVVARAQTAGRGRLGRRWHSPDEGNVYLSLVHWPSLPPGALAGLTLDVGTAVAEVLAARGVPIGLKWPNDLLVGGRKLGGVLCELVLDLDRPCVLVGVGVNVGSEDFPIDINGLATSVRLVTGASPDPLTLAEALVHAVRRRLSEYGRRGGPDLGAYAAFFAHHGRRVRWGEPAVEGTVVGVAADGGLRVEVGGVERVVRSGEVSLVEEEVDDGA